MQILTRGRMHAKLEQFVKFIGLVEYRIRTELGAPPSDVTGGVVG